MPPSWPIVLAGVLGLVLVFAAVIVIGLKARAARITRRLREVTADTAWRELADRDPGLAAVVPGQRFAMQLTIEKGLDPDKPEGLMKVTETL